MKMACVVKFCKSHSSEVRFVQGEISFHSFPVCLERREKWIAALQRRNWMPSTYSRICSKHFRTSDYVPNGSKYRRLKWNAVPTIFNRYPESSQTKDMSAVKQANSTNNDNVDASLSCGVKQEIQLTPEVEEKCAQITSTPPGAGSVNVGQGLSIKDELEDADMDVGPTLLQHMDSCYRTNQQSTSVVKTENPIGYDGRDPVLCSGVEEESVDDKFAGVDGQQCAQAISTPASAGIVKHGIHITVEGTNLVIVPAVLQHRANQQETSVVQTENTTAYESNDPVPCSRVEEESVDDDAEPTIYSCGYCQQTFTKIINIKRHFTYVHSSRSFNCNQCDKLFKCERHLKAHKVLHKQIAFAKACNVCGRFFRCNLKKHMNRIHRQQSTGSAHHHQSSSVSPLVRSCGYCQKIISTKNLSTHIKNMHTNAFYKCSKCKMSFKSEFWLLKHIKVHSKEKHEEHNQQSTYNMFGEKSGGNTLPPVGEVNAATSASTQQQDVVVMKEEPAGEELELGPVIFQHMDCNYRLYKNEPLLD